MKYRLFTFTDHNYNIPKDQLDHIKDHLMKIWAGANLEHNFFIIIDDFVILKNNSVDESTKVEITSPKNYKDHSTAFEQAYQKKVKELIEKYNLTVEQIKKLHHEFKIIEKGIDEYKSQLDFLEKTALEIYTESINEKLMKNFIEKYSQFNKCLSSDLQLLDIENKNQVKILLDDLNIASKKVEDSYLTQSF